MTSAPAKSTLLTLVLALSLSGCALLPHHRNKWAKITPVLPQAAQPGQAADGLYEAATRSIERRDYATALDQLQGARARKPDDIRVLNAFAVVYDKLGRFDLSARYYAQARALDPQSIVVAHNLAYSAELQSRLAAPLIGGPAFAQPALQRPAALVLARAEAARTPSASAGLVTQVAPGVVRLEAPSGLASSGPPAGVMVLAARPAGLTGRPLAVLDASGRGGGADPVRSNLLQLGWSAEPGPATGASPQARTAIRYAKINTLVAQALARTLPAQPDMVACESCDGVELVVGADALGWKFRPRVQPRPTAAQAG